MRIGRFLGALALTLALAAAGCATHAELRRGMVDDVRQGHYVRALSTVEKLAQESPEQDEVMNLMDRALLLHRLGRYEESNAVLERIKDKLDKLYGVKVSDELAAIAWNEASRSFEGEEFERVMVNLLAAFNYMHLGRLEDAAVEARQINHNLQVYTDRLARNDVKSRYVQDPFAQYIAGLIQEATGDDNAAFRSYEDAYLGYADFKSLIGLAAPEGLGAAMLRAARRLGYAEAVEKYEPLFGHDPAADPAWWEGKGRLVVVAALGEVAHKESEKWLIPDPQFDVINVTYPVFRRGRSMAKTASVRVGGAKAETAKAHDLSTLAIVTLDDKNGQVKARAVAKAVARYAAKKVTKAVMYNTKNDTARAAAIIANIALNVVDIAETADTRSWMTLPDHLRLAVLPVEPGERTVSVRFAGGGAWLDEQSFILPFKAGETRFLVVRGREPGGGEKDPPAAPKDARPAVKTESPKASPIARNPGGERRP